MNRAIKFSLILAFLLTGLASAGFANLIQDPTASTIDIFGGNTITGTPTQRGDWIVSGSGSAVGDGAFNGQFFISNGSYTVTVRPDLTGHTVTFPATGAYAVSMTFTANSSTTLTIFLNGTQVATGTGTSTTVSGNLNVASTSDVLTFVFSGTGNNNGFTITNSNLVATGPEPKSIGAAALLLGLVGCTERRRLGGLMSWISGRCARLFS